MDRFNNDVKGVTSRPDLIFISVTRLHRDSNGRLRSINPLMSSNEWEPFLQSFHRVTVLARVEPELVRDEGYLIDERIEVVPIPFYSGAASYLRKRADILSFVSEYISVTNRVYYMWVPAPFALTVSRKIKAMNAPLILRVIGDPAGVARSVVPTPGKHLAAHIQNAKLRKTVKLADGVIYVTLRTLQELYPPSRKALVQARTDVVFSPELLAVPKKQQLHKSEIFSIVAVGSQNQNYKGHDLLIRAVSSLQRQGYPVSLSLIGEGAKHEELKILASKLRVDRMSFIKRLGTSADVARFISTFDMFAMPSRTEGMPKALLEAMAVGVLSIGSRVGGIPELLEEECLFEPNSALALERRIASLIDNDELAEEQREIQAEKINTIRQFYSGNQVVDRFLKKFLERVVYS